MGCGFAERSHELARASAPYFDGIALSPGEHGATAVWSERGGLFTRELDRDGAPRGEARRIGQACPGGVAATRARGRLRIACGRPADVDRDRAGGVDVLDESGREIMRFASAFDRLDGVSIDADDERLAVAFRNADATTSRAMLAVVDRGAAPELSTLSQPSHGAGAPSVRFIDGRWHVAWTESRYEGGAPLVQVLVQREGEAPRPSLRIREIDGPVELTDDDGTPIVTLRDQRPAGASTRSFTGHLDEHLALDEDHLRSPSRADGDGARPLVLRCDDARFSVSTRQSSRGVTMVAIRRLDETLAHAEDEQQIYEYHRRFERAVAACVDGGVLVLVGERQTDLRSSPRLSTYRLECGAGRAHDRTPH
ncbi:MAG: hypothetical protein AB7S26_38435 [Sandaracinaceae bacterium]